MNQHPLKYKDAQLHQPDIQSLQPKQWLTAEAIYFGIQYLIQETPENIKVLDPSLATFLSFEDEFEDLLSIQEQIKNKSCLITAINDMQGNQGTHWGVLLYNTEKFYLFDSGQGSNLENSAKNIAKKLIAILKNDETLLQNNDIEIIRYPNTPKQQNTYDCGIYSLAFIQLLVQSYVQNKEWNFKEITIEFTQNLRIQLRNALANLMQK